MLLLFKLFLDICLFRAGPQDIPHSRVLMNVTVAVYFLLSLFITLVDNSFATAIVSVAVDVIMMLGITIAGLALRQFMNRIPQTVTALAGTGIVFDLVSWPLAIMASQFSADQLLFPQYLLYLLLFWNIGIIGHILKLALSIPYWGAIIISVFYILTYYNVINTILGVSN